MLNLAPFPFLFFSLQICSFAQTLSYDDRKQAKKACAIALLEITLSGNCLSMRSTVNSVLFFGGIIPGLFPCKNTEKRTERCTTRLISKEGVVHFKPNQYILKKGFWKVKFKLTLTYDKLNTKIIYPLEIPMKRTLKL